MPLFPAHSPTFIIAWILASMIIGFLGKNRKLGSFGSFLVSFFFSPLVGVIVLLVSDPKPRTGA